MAVDTLRADRHDLVDTLPDDDVLAAHRCLGFLQSEYTDLLRWAVDTAPIDDEPSTPEEELAVAEAWEDIRNGRTIPMEEIKRHLFV